MHKYRELQIWQRAMSSTVAIYKETRTWPSDERYGLISQTRRAASSIPLNIAEGSGNSSNKEFRRFLEIALRSTYEVMTALEVAQGIEILPAKQADDFLKEINEIAAMLVGLMKSLGWQSTIHSAK